MQCKYRTLLNFRADNFDFIIYNISQSIIYKTIDTLICKIGLHFRVESGLRGFKKILKLEKNTNFDENIRCT